MKAVLLAALLAAPAAGEVARPEAGGGAIRAEEPPPVTLREHVEVRDRAWLRVGTTVTVTDRAGNPARGLTRQDFTLLEDGAPVTLEEFAVEGDRADRPLSVAVLLDLSGSMGSQIREVREAARALLRGLRPGDEIAVGKFSDQVTVLMPFTSDPGEPDRALGSIGIARGGTALFAAIEDTLKDLRHRRGRKVILVVSDGLDNYVERQGHVLQSLYLQDLLRLAFRTQTVVYGIRPGPSVPSWTHFEGFVEQTGGRLLYTGGDLPRLFARLGEEFKSQYYLAWDIDPKLKEKKHRRIRVEVARDDLVVRAMGGFFTPAEHVEALLREALDDDPRIRADAVHDLGFVDDPRALQALRAALTDKDAAVRAAAAEALARPADAPSRAGDTESILRVGRLLDDREAAVREAAAAAMRRFGLEAQAILATRVERGAKERRPRAGTLVAAGLLGEIGDDRAAAPLGTLLQDGAAPARLAAAAALGALGLATGLPHLRAALDDPLPEVRRSAAESFGAIAGLAGCDILTARAARETDAAARAGMLRVLAGLPAPGCDRMPSHDRR